MGPGRALYQEMKARVLDGTYAAGTALPSTRACAAERGLSRSTVSVVYEQLAAEGFIETQPGGTTRVAAGATKVRIAGTAAPSKAEDRPTRLSAFGERVSRLVPGFAAPAGPGLIDFVYGPLAGRDFPTTHWMKALRKVEGERPARLGYVDPRGELALRRALQAYLARARGLACEVDQLLVVNGSQQALDLSARVLLDVGDTVAVENPGYRMAHHVFEAAGARLQGLPVDTQGLCTDELERVRNAKLAYVTPAHQFPLGSFLTMGRRQALLQWAADRAAWVVEDDYDSEYRYGVRPEEALQSLDERGSVIYVGTFSKTLSPQLRLGYMVLPESLVAAFVAAKQLTDRHAPTSPQRVLARLLEDGSYDRHVRRIRRLQHSRRTALLSALERHLGRQVTVQGSATGLHCVAWLPGLPQEREAEFVAAVRRERVIVYPLSPFFLPGGVSQASARPAGLVLGYSLLEPDTIELGVERIAGVLRTFASSSSRKR
jgi:GntR family transcriptional regulator/MocR family aminotransferase